MECVILLRQPSGKVVYATEGDEGDIAVFPDFDTAIRAANNLPTVQAGWVYQIVELDEL